MRKRSRVKMFWTGGLLLPVLLAAAGCGKTATIAGKVSYQGRRIRHGSVICYSADKTARSGSIEPDGSYAVSGVPPGTVKIAVISRDPSKGRSSSRAIKPAGPGKKEAGPQEAAAAGWFPLPPALESPDTSGLSCDVASRQVVHDLELK